jgi:MFS family permease
VNSIKTTTSSKVADASLIDSSYAARRLLITLILMTLCGSSMYVVSEALPEVQRDFDVTRADASLPYTLMILGFGAGGLAMGRLANRMGVHVALEAKLSCQFSDGMCLARGSVKTLDFSL